MQTKKIVDDSQTSEMATDLENAVYKAAVGIFEDAEHKRLISGNGHHMAQEIARQARQLFVERLTGPSDGLRQEVQRREAAGG